MRGVRTTFPSPSQGGEGRAALAAKGEGAVPFWTSPSPWHGFAAPFPLSLKGVRGLGVSTQGDEDRAEHAVHVRHHIGVGEAQDLVAALFERSGARGVVSLSVPVGVAVELNHEPLAAAGEIGDVGREDGLLLELHAQAVRAEVGPKAAFGFGEISAQVLGAVSGFDVPFDRTFPSPRSASLSRPLPLKGARASVVRHSFTQFESLQTVNA